MPSERLAYKRERFSTRLPADRLYTPSHYWLWQQEGRRWRVGFTKFAMRMLGETVEFDFEVAPGAQIALGEVLGWLEGFKATTDVYSVGSGSFVRANPILDEDPERLYRFMYDDGWFYEFDGEPDPAAMDAESYIAVLDTTIDKMQETMK